MYHFKACTPEQTIFTIQQILRRLHIDTEEQEVMCSAAGTYSLILKIKHTNFATNGKGITLELAKASAYAELIERLSGDVLWPRLDYEEISGFHCVPDEKLLTAEEILCDQNPFMQLYRRTMGDSIRDAEDFSNLHIYDNMKY